MKKEDESYESVNLSNTTATKPGWLLYYILEIYQLIKSISGKNINYFNIFIIFPNFFSV